MTNEHRIIQLLSVDRFKRLEAVRWRPGPSLNVIAGVNAAGKSSLIDAIASAFGGKASCPPEPTHDGADRAEVLCDLGDIVVRRVWTDGGERSRVEVLSKDGTEYRRPQEVLDALVGRLTFDPLAFARMKPAEQAALLRDLAGLDTSDLDAQIEAARRERTEVGRVLRTMQGSLKLMPWHEGVEPEPARYDVGELIERRDALLEAGRRYKAVQVDLETAWARVDRLEAELADAHREARRLEKLRDELTCPDEAEYHATNGAVKQAIDLQRQARENAERAARQHECDATDRQHAALEDRILTLEERRKQRIAAARMPVAGLDVLGDAVQYRGVPLCQASQAETIRLGLEIGAALNPTLRVVLVRDGSLLDDAAMAALADWCERRGMQAFVERVGEDAGPTGIVIEDGRCVREVRPGEAPAGQPPGTVGHAIGAAGTCDCDRGDVSSDDTSEAPLNNTDVETVSTSRPPTRPRKSSQSTATPPVADDDAPSLFS